jgi:hypothetical protein
MVRERRESAGTPGVGIEHSLRRRGQVTGMEGSLDMRRMDASIEMIGLRDWSREVNGVEDQNTVVREDDGTNTVAGEKKS